METRYDALIDGLRRAARADSAPPAEAQDYADTVRKHAYRVTDSQVTALRAAGLSEDDVFEITVAAAVGAGLERLHAALGAME